MASLQLWGGAECTINRTRDGYRDQTALSGHYERAGDLDLFATLGLAAIRYPILWERQVPDPATPPNWSWTDRQLARLREMGIRPIAGLVHHGSGPRHTDLLDPGFAPGLGRYAGEVARRYPWIEDWTPVNEPLTTARFSALYGHWYPHVRDERAFWCALLNQIDGTRAAMRAVRHINPHARLIQTDDLGRTYSTVRLGEQAGFDNLRRWVAWDLLFGRVTSHHPLWERIDRFGFGDRLRRIADDPCPPDVVGVNHYLTSDRFLDHRLQRYPPATHGGNGSRAYADTEAVRVLDPAPPGLAGALREAWQRYATPLAVTEVHNGCTREEQLRWAAEAWDTAIALRDEGIDIRAVTAWSLLGSHGWNTLLTRTGNYETGVFDVSTGNPRPTALARLWRGLREDRPRHPVTGQAGWWRRPDRLIYPPTSYPRALPARTTGADTPTLLICGATGVLGQAFARACARRGIRYRLTARDTIDLTRPDGIASALDGVRPWGVVNAAGWSRADDAEDQAAACHAVNATGAIALARACADRGIASLNISSALVFDGAISRPYVESDTPAPLGAYGRSKVAMEAGCADLPGALIVRTGALFSCAGADDFASTVAATLVAGRKFRAADDYVISPGFGPSIVDAALDLLIDEAEGVWHVTGAEALTWAAFAARIAEALGHAARSVEPVPGEALGWRAPGPRNAALGSTRCSAVTGLDLYLAEVAARHRRHVLSSAA